MGFTMPNFQLFGYSTTGSDLNLTFDLYKAVTNNFSSMDANAVPRFTTTAITMTGSYSTSGFIRAASFSTTGAVLAGSFTTSGTVTAGSFTTAGNLTITNPGFAQFKFSNPGIAGTYTLDINDRCKLHTVTAVVTVTLPISVFNAGDFLYIYNNSGGNVTMSAATGGSIIFYNGTSRTSGTSRTIPYGAMAFISCVTGGATPIFHIGIMN